MELPRLLTRRRGWRLARLVVNGFGQAGAAYATARLVQLAFDRAVLGGAAEPQTLLWIGLGLLGAGLLTAGLRMLERTDSERLGQDYVSTLRLALFDRLTALAPRALQRRSSGGVLLRFVGDLTALRQWVSLGLARLTVAGVSTTAALAALALLSWRLALVVAVVIAAGAGSALWLGRRLQSAVEEARRRRAQLAANVGEKISSMAVVQVFGQTDRERRRLGRQSRRLREAMIDRARVSGLLRGVTEVSASLATAGTLLLGAFEVAAGRASPGTVVAAMAVVGLIVGPLRDLGRTHEYWQGARVARRKVLQFLNTPAYVNEAPGSVSLVAGAGRLELDAVHIQGSLQELSAVAEAGTRVAVVGPNGSGKSTLLALAARLLDPERGRVLIDGQDLAGCTLDSVRRMVGMVSPELPLLRGSIEKNLRYRWRRAPQEEVDQVCALCGVDEVLAGLPDGGATRLSEGGSNLSVGQRQRIALARALLGDPRILLLDEADANLDPRSAEVLDRVLADYRGTVLMVTHRPDRLAAADAIWYLQGGRLVQQGKPRDLLQAEGPTRDLFGPQLSLVV